MDWILRHRIRMGAKLGDVMDVGAFRFVCGRMIQEVKVKRWH